MPSDMQSLKLADDLFDELRSGLKSGTVRAGRRDIQLGQLRLESVNGTRPDLVVDVIRVSFVRIKDLTQADADIDGAASPRELFEVVLRRHYPHLTEEDVVTVAEFRKSAEVRAADVVEALARMEAGDDLTWDRASATVRARLREFAAEKLRRLSASGFAVTPRGRAATQ